MLQLVDNWWTTGGPGPVKSKQSNIAQDQTMMGCDSHGPFNDLQELTAVAWLE